MNDSVEPSAAPENAASMVESFVDARFLKRVFVLGLTLSVLGCLAVALTHRSGLGSFALGCVFSAANLWVCTQLTRILEKGVTRRPLILLGTKSLFVLLLISASLFLLPLEIVWFAIGLSVTMLSIVCASLVHILRAQLNPSSKPAEITTESHQNFAGGQHG